MPDHASSDEAPFFSLSYAIYTAGPVRGDEQRANNRGSLAFIAKSQASPRGAIRKPITFKLYLTLRWRPPWARSCCLYYFHSLLISARHLCHLLQRRNIFTHPISEVLLLFSRSPKALRIATGFSKKTSGLRSVFPPAIWLPVELIEIHLDRVSTSMTVIFFLPGQSQCSLLNYTGVHNAALHKIYCSIGSLLVGVAAMVNVITVITLLWQQRLSNRRQIKICLTQFLKIFFFFVPVAVDIVLNCFID